MAIERFYVCDKFGVGFNAKRQSYPELPQFHASIWLGIDTLRYFTRRYAHFYQIAIELQSNAGERSVHLTLGKLSVDFFVQPGPGLRAWTVLELVWGANSIFTINTTIRVGKGR